MRAILDTTVREGKKIEYPCLMTNKNKDTVLLFFTSGEGTVVWTTKESDYLLAEYIEFNDDEFVLFEGTVTLSND